MRFYYFINTCRYYDWFKEWIFQFIILEPQIILHWSQHFLYTPHKNTYYFFQQMKCKDWGSSLNRPLSSVTKREGWVLGSVANHLRDFAFFLCYCGRISYTMKVTKVFMQSLLSENIINVDSELWNIIRKIKRVIQIVNWAEATQ